MSEAESEERFSAGELVWYRDTTHGWWPCSVTEVCEGEPRLLALGDNHDYGFQSTTSGRVRHYSCSECQEKVRTRLQRLKNKGKKSSLQCFITALREASEIQNPFFLSEEDLLKFESGLDLSSSSLTPKTPQEDGYWAGLDDSSIFTPGTSSGPEINGTCSTRRRSRRHHLVQEGATHSDILPAGRSKRKMMSQGGDHTGSVRKKLRKAEDEGNREKEKRREGEEGEEGGRGVQPVEKRLLFESSEESCVSDILNEASPLLKPRGRTVPEKNEKEEEGSKMEDEETGGEGGEQEGGEVHSEEEHVHQDTARHKPKPEKRKKSKQKGVNSKAANHGGVVQLSRSVSVDIQPISPPSIRPVSAQREEEKRGSEEREGDGKGEGEGDAEGGPAEEESSSGEDDFPTFQTNNSTDVIIHHLKEGDIIWVKYHNSPHWPAVVIQVRTRKNVSEATAKVLYFGYPENQDPFPIKHRSRKNYARFVIGNDQFEEFWRLGNLSNYKELFLQSVNEAQSYLTADGNGELTGTAKEKFHQICAQRRPQRLLQETPMEVERKKRMARLAEELEQRTQPPPPAFGEVVEEDSMTCGSSDSEDSGPEDENSPYTVEKILDYFQQLKPTLEGIVKEEVASAYHTTFMTGTNKQKFNLRKEKKFGPCRDWSTKRKMKLLKFLEAIALSVLQGKMQMAYSMDVLLPEAMMRTISHFECISKEEAQKKL